MGVGAVNLDILYFSLPFLVVFVLKHNVDENNMRNINVRIHVKVKLQEIGCDLTYPLFGFNEQLIYWKPISWKPIKIFLDPRKKLWPTQRPTQKVLDPRKNIFDPRNPRKNYDPRKKYFDPRNPRDLADSIHTSE